MEAFHRDESVPTETAGRLSIETIGDGPGTRALRAPLPCKDSDLSRSDGFDVLLPENCGRVRSAAQILADRIQPDRILRQSIGNDRTSADQASVRYQPTMHSHAPTIASMHQSHMFNRSVLRLSTIASFVDRRQPRRLLT